MYPKYAENGPVAEILGMGSLLELTRCTGDCWRKLKPAVPKTC